MSFTFPRESEILLSDASELCFIVFSSLFFIRDIFPKTFIVYGEKSHFARDQYCELCINLAIIPIFLFFWGRWGHPAMSGKLRYGRKRTFTDMDGHLRTAGDSQQSAVSGSAPCGSLHRLLFLLPDRLYKPVRDFFIFQYLLASTSSSRAFSSGVPIVIRKYFPVISPGK